MVYQFRHKGSHQAYDNNTKKTKKGKKNF